MPEPQTIKLASVRQTSIDGLPPLTLVFDNNDGILFEWAVPPQMAGLLTISLAGWPANSVEVEARRKVSHIHSLPEALPPLNDDYDDSLLWLARGEVRPRGQSA